MELAGLEPATSWVRSMRPWVLLRGTSFGADLRERLSGCDRLPVDPELEKSRPALRERTLESVRKVLGTQHDLSVRPEGLGPRRERSRG